MKYYIIRCDGDIYIDKVPKKYYDGYIDNPADFDFSIEISRKLYNKLFNMHETEEDFIWLKTGEQIITYRLGDAWTKNG